MSRTHAHRPLWAWAAVPEAMVARHDHRDGPCDLLPLDDWLTTVKSCQVSPWQQFACRWDVDWYAIPPICSCAMCSGRADRRRDTRRERRAVRQLLARWDEDLDDLVPGHVARQLDRW